MASAESLACGHTFVHLNPTGMLFINSAVNKQTLKVCGWELGSGGVGAAVNKKGMCCPAGQCHGGDWTLPIMQWRAHKCGAQGGAWTPLERTRRTLPSGVCELDWEAAGTLGNGGLSRWWGHHKEGWERAGDREMGTAGGQDGWGAGGKMTRLEADTGLWKPCQHSPGFSS